MDVSNLFLYVSFVCPAAATAWIICQCFLTVTITMLNSLTHTHTHTCPVYWPSEPFQFRENGTVSAIGVVQPLYFHCRNVRPKPQPRISRFCCVCVCAKKQIKSLERMKWKRREIAVRRRISHFYCHWTGITALLHILFNDTKYARAAIEQNGTIKEKQPLPEEMKNFKATHSAQCFCRVPPELCGQNLIFHIEQKAGVVCRRTQPCNNNNYNGD